ncbi:MAG: pimeloyl-ACP methyl ester carboxylesterase [Cyclobacteriaceae bacterium]|jgi:pimeloyl-ACP methyl ester carboxylesterase
MAPLAGAGHRTQQEAPAAVNEAILRFFTSIAGS